MDINEQDFEKIINESKAYVLKAISKNLNHNFIHAIDDVAQETYFRAYKALLKNKFRNDANINTWLYSIARNESKRMNGRLLREEVKKQKAKNKFALDIFLKRDENLNLDIAEQIKLLPEKYASVLLLYSQGYNIKNISNELALKSGTVKSLIFRGKALLRQVINGEGS